MNFEQSNRPGERDERAVVIEALMGDGDPDSCETYRRWRGQMEEDALKKSQEGDTSGYVRMEIESAEALDAAGYPDKAREACEEAARQAHNMGRDDILPEVETILDRLS